MPIKLKDGETVYHPIDAETGYAYKIIGDPLYENLENAVCYKARDVDTDEIVFLKAYINPAPSRTPGGSWVDDYVGYNGELYRRIRESDAADYCVAVRDVFIGFTHTFRKSRTLYAVFPFFHNAVDLRKLLKLPAGALDAPTWAERLHLARKFVTGLRLLHEQKIVHTDLKPDNIQIAEGVSPLRYEAKINDMDFAFLADKKAPWTGHRGTTGTPWYYSPEYLSDGSVDARSDVFTACSILCELLCGKHPYRDAPDAAEGYDALLSSGRHAFAAEPPRLLGAHPAAEAIALLLQRGLATEPAARPDLEEISAELARLRPKGGRLTLTGPLGSVSIGLAGRYGSALLNRVHADAKFARGQQFELFLEGGTWFVAPLADVVNPTGLNGVRLEGKTELKDGDEISLIGAKSGNVVMPLKVSFS